MFRLRSLEVGLAKTKRGYRGWVFQNLAYQTRLLSRGSGGHGCTEAPIESPTMAP